MLVVTSAVVSYVVHYVTQENKNSCHNEKNNLFGDLFSASLFLAVICLVNFYTFNPKSFCLMNPFENMCHPYRESLSCANTYNLNSTTGFGHYFSGYAGFFRRNRDKESNNRNPLKCFLDIGRDSWFQFMSLDFGENNKWTESSFVLIDGVLADFQPRRLFAAFPTLTFGWLLDHTIPVNFGQRTTSTGILIFAADSEVQLFYHSAKMSGKKLFSIIF